MPTPIDVWNSWNESGGPNYPHEKVVQFCLRTYPKDVRSRTRALDLGCGSGVNTVFLAGEGFVVSAVDVSTVGVANTRARLARSNLEADVDVASADNVGLPSASFDLVVCISVLECVPTASRAGVVTEAARLLRPDGRALFLFASDRDFRVTGDNPLALHGFARKEVEALFASGFKDAWLDRYTTTYQDGAIEQNDWLVTAFR